MSQISEDPKKPIPEELNEKELETVSGGINPQPLPPHHPPSDD
ncbi:bacteriocin [Granulicella sibirica]|uniref:Uncharacterized protein n=1 Tax=Granulicella sibirica TaxID=2479048 RepID=A0A4Q0SXG9_9BACT|nr:bacteriocin [Granulicella sibirica]RXH54308.1 hypothetical protein GRAN_4604 [Granulicella sibirica]